MELKVYVPNEYTGDIMGDMNKRRGIILGIEPVGDEQIITAEAPQSEIKKYIIDLKTMTQAQATFTMKFIRYSELPAHLVDKVIKENKKED
jgi:elongation factor G